MATDREVVADAFEAWSRGEGHVSKIFAGVPADGTGP